MRGKALRGGGPGEAGGTNAAGCAQACGQGRVIQEHIKKPLADEILFGRLTRGGHVKVVLRDGKLAFDIEGEKREPGAPVIESPKTGRSPAPELAD